jgi:hypothetical protein
VKLTKRQRHDIFGVLQAHGVEPADCDMPADAETAERVVIRHVPTSSIFELFQTSAHYYVNWRVHDGPQSRVQEECGLWSTVLGRLGHWADEVHYVNDTPDLWEELKRAPKILGAVEQGQIGDALFTHDEQAEIAHRLDEVKKLVRERFELTDDQLAAIDQRLDDAEEAAKHADRKTWLYTFYGAAMSTFMTDEIPPHVIQTIVTTVLHGIGHLFGIGGSPPIIGS